MQGSRIDIAISPSHATLSNLLKYRGAAATWWRRTACGAAPPGGAGDHRPRRRQEFQGGWPPHRADRAAEGRHHRAVIRGTGADARVLMAHHDTVIEAEDHLIVSSQQADDRPRREGFPGWSRLLLRL